MKNLVLMFLLFISSVNVFATEDMYLTCEGKTGTSPLQSSLYFTARTITDAVTKVSGSVKISDKDILINGIPYVDGKYKVCSTDELNIYFSYGEYEDCVKDVNHDMGVLDKVTGKLTYHGGDFLAILHCKKTSKVIH
jgi:hypothetical protein